MTRAWRRRRDGEDGIVAGGEALLLGTLVFVVGSLLIISAWTLVDAKLAVESAAREAARAVVEAPSSALNSDATLSDSTAQRLADDAALARMTAQRGDPDAAIAGWSLVDVRVTGQFQRCGAITSEVRITVDTPRLPIVGRRLTAGQLVGTHTERIEPYRSGLPVAPGGISC